MLMNNFLITITLSETEKRVLFIVFFIFILLLFFCGLLVHLNNKISEKQGRKIDKVLAGYVKYGFVKNAKEFKTLAKEKNKLLLLKQMILPMIILATGLSAFLIFIAASDKKFSYIFEIYYDMLIRFEVETTKIFGFLDVWTSWPKITEDSFVFHSSPEAIVAYIFLIVMIIGLILYGFATFSYIAREKRYKEKAKTIFEVSVEKEEPIDNTNLDKVEPSN